MNRSSNGLNVQEVGRLKGAAPTSKRTRSGTSHEVGAEHWKCPLIHEPAKVPNDLEKFFVERANAGDVEGLVALYESDAIVAYGDGQVAIGRGQIRDFFVKFLADRPQLDPSIQAPALCSGDLALTSSRLSNGDITAEVARRQPDGRRLWVLDKFAIGTDG